MHKIVIKITVNCGKIGKAACTCATRKRIVCAARRRKRP